MQYSEKQGDSGKFLQRLCVWRGETLRVLGHFPLQSIPSQPPVQNYPTSFQDQTGKICNLLTPKRESCYKNTEITRLHVCVLYRSESPFVNLNLSWMWPSNPFIKAGAIRTGDLAIQKIKKLKEDQRERNTSLQLEKDVLKELVLGGRGMEHS